MPVASRALGPDDRPRTRFPDHQTEQVHSFGGACRMFAESVPLDTRRAVTVAVPGPAGAPTGRTGPAPVVLAPGRGTSGFRVDRPES